MKLRPHHLLCTQGYSGKGYNDEFVEHMTEIVKKLRDNLPIEIELVFTTDELCSKCPHKLGEDYCDTNEHVKRLDQKVVEFFNLKPGKYIYQDLIGEIAHQMTESKMDAICSECSWYSISACKTQVLKRSH